MLCRSFGWWRFVQFITFTACSMKMRLKISFIYLGKIRSRFLEKIVHARGKYAPRFQITRFTPPTHDQPMYKNSPPCIIIHCIHIHLCVYLCTNIYTKEHTFDHQIPPSVFWKNKFLQGRWNIVVASNMHQYYQPCVPLQLADASVLFNLTSQLYHFSPVLSTPFHQIFLSIYGKIIFCRGGVAPTLVCFLIPWF